ncbi:MAG: ABC transporter permease [Spirochaetales bacterium]|nr:ABC transporter permease [Spirochaetales bacterium]
MVLDRIKFFGQRNKQLLGMLGAIAVMLLVLSISVENFMTWTNITNLLAQVAPIAFMATGITFVLITKGMDISGPAVMAASSVIAVAFITSFKVITAVHLISGCMILLLAGGFFGFINGLAIAKLKMVPLVVTLSMMTVATGLATVLGGARGLPTIPSAYANFFNKYTVIVMVILISSALDFLLTGTSFGRKVYYIGNKEETARISGINTDNVILIVYIICGICAALAGIVNVAIISTARASMGPQSQILDVVSAAVIGGVSVQGGKGRVRDACLGAFLIVGVNNVMNLIGVSDYFTTLIKGSIIIFAMGISSFRQFYFSRIRA